MARHTAKADHHTGMLNGVILVKQARTHNADLFLAEAQHPLKQVRMISVSLFNSIRYSPLAKVAP